MVTTSPTFAQVESITREELLQTILREGGFGGYGTVTASGSTTTITDTTRLKSTQYNSQEWVGGWARISFNASGVGAAPETEIRPITAYVPSTGIITVNPAFSTAPTTSDRYELWKFPNPRDVIDTIDSVMQEDIWLPSWTMLSEVPDHDMEQDNTNDWNDVNGAAGSKVTDEPSLFGGRWMEVVNSGVDGYVRPGLLNVAPQTGYYIGAICLPIGNKSATLEILDVTNSAVIDSVAFTGQYAAGIGFDFETPSSCEQIQIRLKGDDSDAIIRWDEIIFYPTGAPDIALPWWVKNKSQVKGVFHTSKWLEATAVSYPSQIRGLDSSYDFMDNAFGRGQLRLFKRSGSLRLPLMMYGTRNPVAFTNDTVDNRRIDKNYLKATVLWKIFNNLNNDPIAGRFETSWLKDKQEQWEREYLIQQYKQMERIEQTLQGHTEYRQFA